MALLLLTVTALAATAQMLTPVKWRTAMKMTGDKDGVVTMTATIDPGWHLYAHDMASGGPQPLEVKWNTLDGVTLKGGLTASTAPHEQMDDMFDMKVRWWASTVTLTQKFTATKPTFKIDGSIGYQACNDEMCTAPSHEPMTFKGTAKVAPDEKADDDAPTALETLPAATQPDTMATDCIAMDMVAQAADSAAVPATWSPVTVDNGVGDMGGTGASGRGLWFIFWACFLGGLLALLTPCVWPIIPMTVSFFLKKSDNKKAAVRNAVTYGLSIVVIYVTLGMVVSAIFGASTLNALSTNAVCNIIFFLLLVVFALSFFGAFELTLPASWSSKMDRAAEGTTGLLSIFFMAFTLVIVSFSCTGPIIGTLLVEAASQGNRVGPAVGMLGFAIALAIPFTLFALFPSWLKKLPRSGGWLNTVKVVLGFIELALSLKFLSVADMAYGWHILDRETFLALWIAIFLLLGFYLLGLFRFKSDGEPASSGIGVTRFMLGLVSLAFTAYLVPGLWGAPLRATSAFVPPLSTQDFNLYGEEKVDYADYDAALAAAASQGKPVLVDFSGYGCVNCRKMESAVVDKAQVRHFIGRHFITVKLMVDDKTALPQPLVVHENGREVTLTTVGDKWSYLQRHKFNANSQPYYVALDAQGRLLSGPAVYREDIPYFMDFLRAALK